ncbi:MAG: N-acetyltransferase family protein [Candidatus Eisenbacteria bacterium]|nr:GNAT family N-acetyltransferase [Candidatus Eisenbacteria bacterium]
METLRRLTSGDAARYARLRLRMLHDSPWAFGSSPEDDFALDREHLVQMFASEAEAATVAFEDPETGELIAAAGVRRESKKKFRHRATIWGVYVEPAHRGKGLGAELIATLLEIARGWPGVDYVDLGVSEGAPEAKRLYERFGFRAWGREPGATQLEDGRRFDEIHMTLLLHAPSDGSAV